MNNKEDILQALKTVAAREEFGHFYLPDHFRRPHLKSFSHTCDRLLFVLSGVKREPLCLNGSVRTVELTAGDAYLLRRNVREYASWETPHTLLCIVPQAEFLRISLYEIKKPQGHFPWPDALFYHTGRPCSAALQFVFNALAATGENNPAATGNLLRAAAAIAVAECETTENPAGKAAALFEKIRFFVEKNCRGPVTREMTATHFHVTPEYVSRLFRRYLNCTLQEFLLECRIRIALQLLSETDLPVKEIAGECGFQDPSYFIRCFKQSQGVPPGEFRLK